MMNHWQLTTQERTELLDFTQRLVRTPSLPGDEGAVAALIAEEMERLGFSGVQVDAAGNVLGSVGEEEGPTLLFDSHMDTVEVAAPESWSVDPWAAELHQGRLYGLGSCDMKGGLAATLYGAAHLLNLGLSLPGRLLVAAVGLEEPAEGTCTRILFEEDGVQADWVVIAEPSNLQVIRAQRGHMEMNLTVLGRSAHSATPDLGENAIYAMARAIFGLELLSEQLAEDPFLGPGVLAVTDIRSHAVSRNAVPERCEIIIDRRLTLGETEAQALAEIQRIIAREGLDAQISIIEEEILTYTGKAYHLHRVSPPWAFNAHHPLVEATLRAAHDVGLRPGLGKWLFATEGAYTAGVRQIPTIGFGPGNPNLAHTCDEYVELEQVYSAAAAYAALAARLLDARA